MLSALMMLSPNISFMISRIINETIVENSITTSSHTVFIIAILLVFAPQERKTAAGFYAWLLAFRKPFATIPIEPTTAIAIKAGKSCRRLI